MSELRPITLRNVIYKIIVKVLANRLKDLLPRVISENQSAFIPGRNISDNVLATFEVLYHIKRKNRGNEGEVALKLDISKAYDRVDWKFLKHRMRTMGFNEKWVQWIMQCVTTVSYKINFNGKELGPIIPKRGLRQGDALSPYIFLFCVEDLSHQLTSATREGMRCQISERAPSITHLLFTDDSFLFFKATSQEAIAIKGILNTYERSLDKQ